MSKSIKASTYYNGDTTMSLTSVTPSSATIKYTNGIIPGEGLNNAVEYGLRSNGGTRDNPLHMRVNKIFFEQLDTMNIKSE